MTDIIDEIKDKVRIEDLVEESGISVQRRGGRYLRAKAPKGSGYNSLVLDTQHNCYHWNGNNESGDVIRWVQNRNPGWDFRMCLEHLAAKAGLELPPVREQDMTVRLAARAREEALQVAVRVFERWLSADQEALAYATGRGWSVGYEEEGREMPGTVELHHLGFSGRGTPAEYEDMRGEMRLYGVDLESAAAVAVLGYRGDVRAWKQAHQGEIIGEEWNTAWEEWGLIPGMMGKKRLVYAHYERGRVVNLTGRNILGDETNKDGREVKSYNLPVTLIGRRSVYYNEAYSPRAEEVVLIEGQADAITLGQWGVAAIAWAGTGWKDHEDLLRDLTKRHDVVYLALDADAAGVKTLRGKEGTYPLMDVIGPLARSVKWKQKDANDWLQWFVEQGVGQDDQLTQVRNALQAAKPLVVALAEDVGQAIGAEHDRLFERLAGILPAIDEKAYWYGGYRQKIAKAASNHYMKHAVTDLDKAYKQKVATDDGEPREVVETMGGWFPTSPDGEQGWLLEPMYDPATGVAAWAYRDPEGKIASGAHVDMDGIRYVPWVDDNIRYGTVKLPSELVPEERRMSTREILAAIETYLRKYFLLADDVEYQTAALYPLFTWVYDAFPTLPFLRARGPAGSGKSELMILIGRVSYRMITTAGLTTLAGYKGLAHLYKGTLFIDEVDRMLYGRSQDNGELSALLNVRAMKEQARIVTMMDVLKADGTHTYRPATTNVYGPTLMTMYRGFKDDATETRTISIEMQKRSMDELEAAGMPEPGVTPPEMIEMAQRIRNLLLRWRLEVWQPRMEVSETVRLSDRRVSARVNQVMRPLKVLAYTLGDKQLLDDLVEMGRQNYEKEMGKITSSFEASVFRAIVEVSQRKSFSEFVKGGNLKGYGAVRYALSKDIAMVTNLLLDEENYSEGVDVDAAKKKNKAREVTSQTVLSMCREYYRLPTERTNKGYVVIFDPDLMEAGARKYGLDQILDLDEQPEISGNGNSGANQAAMNL